MHGTAQWVSLFTWFNGGTIVLPDNPERLDPCGIWGTVEKERITFLLVVGDAFVRPLLDELDRGRYDPSSLTVVFSGGAPLGAPSKRALLAHLPTLMIVDGLGASEGGGQLSQVYTGGCVPSGAFPIAPPNVVLSADRTRVLAHAGGELGWLAKRGRLALGYLDDPDRTAATYPVIDGVRYAVPGDRARLRGDGVVEVPGRDSATINTGGEKVFAEEVEAAVRITPTSTTASWPAGRAGAGDRRWSPWCSSAPAARPTRRPCSTWRRPSGALQAAEGVRVRRRGRALAIRQGRLPLGPPARRTGDAMSAAWAGSACAPATLLADPMAAGADDVRTAGDAAARAGCTDVSVWAHHLPALRGSACVCG